VDSRGAQIGSAADGTHYLMVRSATGDDWHAVLVKGDEPARLMIEPIGTGTWDDAYCYCLNPRDARRPAGTRTRVSCTPGGGGTEHGRAGRATELRPDRGAPAGSNERRGSPHSGIRATWQPVSARAFPGDCLESFPIPRNRVRFSNFQHAIRGDFDRQT
jgi:hypothetical protein